MKNNIQASDFKIACHAIGEIMGQKGLGKTGETYVKEWYISKQFKRKKDFYSKYVEKGLQVEETGIEMFSVWLNEGVKLEKNIEWFKNDFMLGCPDVIYNEKVSDIKSSWSLFTFPYFDKELTNKDYWWQLQGYMALTGLKKASLVYCLIDTPTPIVQQELKKLYFQSGGRAEDWTPETYAELGENYKFSDIPDEDRIRVFEIERDDAAIKSIEERVKVCREYLASIIPTPKESIPI